MTPPHDNRAAFELSAGIAVDGEIADILQQVVRRVGEELGVRSCDINEYSAADNSLTYAAVWSRTPSTQEELDYVGIRISLDERPACAAVIEAGRPIDTYLTDEDLDPVERQLMEEWDEPAVLDAPLVYAGETIGIIGVVDGPGRRFSDDDKRLLTGLAVPAAIAIHNARMFHEARERRRQLGSLLDAGRVLTSAVDLQEVLDAVAREAADLVGCPECLIWEYQPDRDGFVWRAWHHGEDPHDWGDEVGAFHPRAEWQDDYEFILQGEQCVDHADDPGITSFERDFMLKNGVSSSVSVPLLHGGGEPVGLLYLAQFGERFEFGERQLALAGGFGELAGAAIHNARLFRAQEAQRERLAGLLKASRSIATVLSLPELAGAVREQVTAAVGEGCRVRLWLCGEDGGLAPAHAGEQTPSSPPLRAAEALDRFDVVQEQAGGAARLLVPFGTRGETAGLVEVTEPGRRAFGGDVVELLRIVANQTAVAVANARLYAKVESQAITDGLSGLYNHRHFYERLEQECARARRYDLPLALLMLDIDDFKRFNDRFGHVHGDEVLRQVAQVLREDTRQGVDIPARYGGEEFAVLLPHTRLGGAGVVGGRLRDRVESLGEADAAIPPAGSGAELVGERLRRDIEARMDLASVRAPELHVTVSVGVAAGEGAGLDGNELVRQADEALYRAKRAGKNRVEVRG